MSELMRKFMRDGHVVLREQLSIPFIERLQDGAEEGDTKALAGFLGVFLDNILGSLHERIPNFDFGKDFPEGLQIADGMTGQGPVPGECQPHIDGLPHPSNDVPEGTVRSFDLLVGVCLSDVYGPHCGGLLVWPGAHLDLVTQLAAGDPLQVLTTLEMPAYDYARHPLYSGRSEHTERPPLELTPQAGDVLVLDYLTPHCRAPNLCGQNRTILYVRLRDPKHSRPNWWHQTAKGVQYTVGALMEHKSCGYLFGNPFSDRDGAGTTEAEEVG